MQMWITSVIVLSQVTEPQGRPARLAIYMRKLEIGGASGSLGWDPAVSQPATGDRETPNPANTLHAV